MGDIRITGGIPQRTGRVEICYQGVWASICNSGHWNQIDATVVCRQLELPTACM